MREILNALAFTGGDWVIYILMILSILTIAVIVERAILLSREIKEVRRIKGLFAKEISEGDLKGVQEQFQGSPSLPAKVVTAGISSIPQGLYVVEETLTNATNEERKRLENRMIILNTLGNNAVYIGLFGTVLGVIKAFRDLALAGGGGAEVVMQGLSEALVATAVGLLVAIPCVVAYNAFQKNIKEILTESDGMARMLMAKLKANAKH